MNNIGQGLQPQCQHRIEPHRLSADEVLSATGTSARSGLSCEEAKRRLARHGRNELQADPPRPAWLKFFDQFANVLVILLIVAAAISAGLWFYERQSALPYEAIAIFVIVLLNALLGYLQEARAEKALAALRQMSAARANAGSETSEE